MAAISSFVLAIQTYFADLCSACAFDSTAPRSHLADRTYLGHIVSASL
ncbi:hypothetical protein [Collinsella bouchesdurhonensis]|nr:hypothetical protein [Collinsella bouchesdurhonensis]